MNRSVFAGLLFLLLTAASAVAGPRVWLVHASHTGGHRAAAQALAEALTETPGVSAQVIDMTSYLPATFRRLQTSAFDVMARLLPNLRRKAFEQSIEGSEATVSSATRGLALKAFLSRSFLDRIRAEGPDVIVSTHSQANVMLSIWKKHGRFDQPLLCVVTDYDTHALWARPEIDAYFVACSRVRDALVRYGVEPSRISITGIPVAPAFARLPQVDPQAARTLLHLDPDLPTVVMLGGSLGYGPWRQVVEALESHGEPVQFLAMTGKNDAARRELETMAPTLASVRLSVYGFVDRMFRFMDAADAVVTKPGGLTVTELLCRGRPMVVIAPSPGLEAHVTAAIVEMGVAQVVPDAAAAAAQALAEARDPALQEQRRIAIETWRRPGAVFDVARAILSAAP